MCPLECFLPMIGFVVFVIIFHLFLFCSRSGLAPDGGRQPLRDDFSHLLLPLHRDSVNISLNDRHTFGAMSTSLLFGAIYFARFNATQPITYIHPPLPLRRCHKEIFNTISLITPSSFNCKAVDRLVFANANQPKNRKSKIFKIRADNSHRISVTRHHFCAGFCGFEVKRF